MERYGMGGGERYIWACGIYGATTYDTIPGVRFCWCLLPFFFKEFLFIHIIYTPLIYTHYVVYYSIVELR